MAVTKLAEGRELREVVVHFPSAGTFFCDREGVLLPAKAARFSRTRWRGPFATAAEARAALYDAAEVRGPMPGARGAVPDGRSGWIERRPTSGARGD